MSDPNSNAGFAIGGRLAAVGSGIAFGALGIFAQAAYRDGADILGLLPLRFLVAGSLLALAARLRREPWPRPRRAALCLLLGGAGYLGFTLLFFATLRHASPGIAALLLYLNPFVVFAWSVAAGRERFHPRALVALAVAAGGLALVLRGGSASGLGIGLGLATALAYGSYLVVASRTLEGLAPLAATALVCLGAGIVAGAAALGIGHELPRTTDGWAAFAGLTLVSTVLALGLLTYALQRIPPTDVATIMMVEPIAAVLLSALVLGHTLTPLQALGAAVTLLACIHFLRRRK